MPAATQYVSSLPGSFSVDLLRLRSPAPAPLAQAVPGGQVLDSGRLGNDSVKGVRLDLRRPTWLVLGESYNTGWQASCNGRSLGAPQVIDGYANGWLAPIGCRSVSFSFAAQSAVNLSYVVSGLVVAALALLLIFTRPPHKPSADSSRTRSWYAFPQWTPALKQRYSTLRRCAVSFILDPSGMAA